MEKRLTKKQLEQNIDDLEEALSNVDVLEYELYEARKEYVKRYKKDYKY